MNEEEKKKWILQRWKFSSGKKIEKMVQRYWGLDERSKLEKETAKQKEIEKAADEAFSDVA